MTNDQAYKIFLDTKALLQGHFLLTSGLHSPNYFQCARVLQYPNHAEAFCAEIANHFRAEKIDYVISPAIGGIVAGQEVARLLGCKAIFAERENNVMTLRRGFEILPGEKALAIEDVVTTGGSIKEVIELVRQQGGVVAGAGFLVDRSAGKVTFDVPKYTVLQMEVVTYTADNCPLCKQGSPVVKPGSRKAIS
ncbi:MAG TPA: orotate phosphoribosyltransferase [bacterium]|nr:orotate phosphoribosyltransferase [bacterium]HPN45820.1 orotate phosphoribosyltransferase [bacterium]